MQLETVYCGGFKPLWWLSLCSWHRTRYLWTRPTCTS